MAETHQLARKLNRHCLCQTLDRSLLEKELLSRLGDDLFLKNYPNMFSQTAVYISEFTMKEVVDLIDKIESAIHSDSFQDEVLKDVPGIALKDFGPAGAFMGYDFHLTDSGPQLIEINTNAGGGLLNLYLSQAQLACCDGTKIPFNLDNLEKEYFQMFVNEWKLQKGEEKFQTVAIIDISPKDQYLYPEFKLFRSLFKKNGLECFILAPEDLKGNDVGIWYGEIKIDLIYNRLTDFYFEQSEHNFLKDAYLKQSVVVTPNPHHHALYANKHNLVPLCKLPELSSGIPQTIIVSTENHDMLWKNRRDYFFKPSKGFGSKGAYRGDKMTHRVWSEVKASDYVAQRIVKPGERIVKIEDGQNKLKVDVRAYTYQGKIQLMSSRLYSGQTTNFRTDGGGFAPVFLMEDTKKYD